MGAAGAVTARRVPRLAVLALAALALVTFTVAGCGGSGGSSSGSGGGVDRALLAPLPASPWLVTVDVAALRRALRLPADADGTSESATAPPAGALRELSDTEALALPYLASAVRSPLPSALDGHQITAIASTGLVTAVRTAQPFDKIATALRASGYRRDGDRLTPPANSHLPAGFRASATPVVSAAGNDVVVLDGRASTATPTTRYNPAALLDKLSGPVRWAAGGDAGTCGDGFAASMALPGQPGTLLVDAGPHPDPTRMLPPASPFHRDYLFQKPTADGRFVEATYTDRPTATASLPSRLAESLVSDLYRCP